MDIGLLGLATLPQINVEAIKVVDIDLNRLSALPQVISEVMDVGQL